MTVWVVQTGVYEDRWVDGAFATIELVIAAYPKGEWTEISDGYWSNDQDWENAATAHRFDVVGAEVGVGSGGDT